MAKKIESVSKIAVTTTAKDEAVNYRAFMIENLDESATVYFKEKNGVACTASNGFAIPPATLIDHVFTAHTLSIVGSGTADVRILYVDCD